MDPGLLLQPIMATPTCDAGALVLPGALMPWILPTEALTPDQRANIARRWSSLAPARRVAWLLTAGDEPAASAVVRSWSGPWPADLTPVMTTWAARCLADLRLPATSASVIVAGGDLPEARLAYDDTCGLLSLPIRWTGPVVVVLGNAPVPGLPPGETSFTRPACPLLRLPELPASGGVRGVLAGRLVPLLLAFQAPPANGWPPWLVTGLARVVAATAAGCGPSPKAMLDRRASAGLSAVRRTLTAPAEDLDPALAEAVATALLTPWRRASLPLVLDHLRKGASSESAIAGATGVTLTDLMVQR